MEETLGKRIVQNRKRLGLTQDQLAEQLGVTAQAVSKWENDQSCPDISMLPRLAEIFSISTDELLGREAPAAVCNTAAEPAEEHEHRWEFHFDGGRRGALCFALTVLITGLLFLLSETFCWDAGFWEILWPVIPLVYGLFGAFPRFSVMRLGCALAGGYFLLNNLGLLPFSLHAKLVWPVIMILLGIWLLAAALKKPKKARVNIKGHHPRPKEQLETDHSSFDFSASFGESTQYVVLSCLRSGSVSTSFGEYTIDLSGVQAADADCTVELNSSFGELTLLVPSRFQVHPTSSTFLAQIHMSGEPDPNAEGMIRVNASAAFGQINIQYI